MPARDSPRFTMRLEPHEIEALRDVAERQGSTMADLVRSHILAIIKADMVPPRPKGPRGPRKKSGMTSAAAE